jgi:Cof subfamily protein (haloacid dehalogenase superfamily)
MFPGSMMSKIKMVAVDLDGTLLRRGGFPSLRTKRAVRAASRKGISVVLATGRSSSTALRVAKTLRLDAPIIACNGAHILSSFPRQDLAIIPIEPSAYLRVIEILRKEGLKFNVHLKGAVAREKQFSSKRRHVAAGFIYSIKGIAYDDIIVLENGSYEELAGKTLKVFLEGSQEFIFQLEQYLREILGDKLKLVQTIDSHGGNLLEIQDSTVDKGNAIHVVASMLGFEKEQIAALGDGDNDVGMISAAGLGIAMANASPKLAMTAKYFTLSCQRDGVAYFLEELVRAN